MGMNEIQIVQNRVEKIEAYPLDDLLVIQGDLKRLEKTAYEKFRNQLLENGFTSPIHIWINPQGKKSVLDGTQRLRTLMMMRDDGISIPEKIPCVLIRAEDEKRARKILLGLAAEYGKMSDESLSDFLIESEIDLSWLNLNIELPFNSSLDVLPEFTDLPDLGDGSDPEFSQMTFIVKREKKELIDNAIKQARGDVEADDENANGAALFSICEAYLNG